MVDASKGYQKDGNKNRLRSQDIHKIVDIFNRQVELDGYSRMVPVSEISDPKNDYNLNLPRYIDSTETEDIQDLEGHLRGGIPDRDLDDLKEYWEVLPSVRPALFEAARPGYSRLKVPADEIKAAIFEHPEFTAFNASITHLFEEWRERHSTQLMDIQIGDRPKALIDNLSEDLLETFRSARLFDAYDVYQHIMEFWAEIMQDDVYLIASGGWMEAAKPRLIVETKEQKSKEEPDFKVGRKKFKSDLIPASLLVTRYFAAERGAIENLEADLTAIDQQLDELKEEHGGEGGLLEEVVDDKGKVSKRAVAARLKEVGQDKDTAEERKVLKEYARMLERQVEVKSSLKAAEADLEAKIIQKYGKLTEPEIKALAVEDKWLAHLAGDVEGELDRVSQGLTSRIQELADRYSTPLPQVAKEVEELTARVGEHLRKMGVLWN